MKRMMIVAALAAAFSAGAQADMLRGNLTGNPEISVFEACHQGKRVLLKVEMDDRHWSRLSQSNEVMFIQSLPLAEQREYRSNRQHRLSMVINGAVALGSENAGSGMFHGSVGVNDVMLVSRHQGRIKGCDGVVPPALVSAR